MKAIIVPIVMYLLFELYMFLAFETYIREKEKIDICSVLVRIIVFTILFLLYKALSSVGIGR